MILYTGRFGAVELGSTASRLDAIALNVKIGTN